MDIVCAWCGNTFGHDNTQPDTVEVFGKTMKNVSHGICPGCYYAQQKEIEKQLKENSIVK